MVAWKDFNFFNYFTKKKCENKKTMSSTLFFPDWNDKGQGHVSAESPTYAISVSLTIEVNT